MQVRGEPVALGLTQTNLRSLTRPSSPLTLGSQMPRVAVTLAYFDFFPELKAELAAMYPDTKFRSDRKPLSEDELIEYCEGYDTAQSALTVLQIAYAPRCPSSR